MITQIHINSHSISNELLYRHFYFLLQFATPFSYVGAFFSSSSLASYQELVRNNNCMQHTYIFVNKLDSATEQSTQEKCNENLFAHFHTIFRQAKREKYVRWRNIITKRWKINVSNGTLHISVFSSIWFANKRRISDKKYVSYHYADTSIGWNETRRNTITFQWNVGFSFCSISMSSRPIWYFDGSHLAKHTLTICML